MRKCQVHGTILSTRGLCPQCESKRYPKTEAEWAEVLKRRVA